MVHGPWGVVQANLAPHDSPCNQPNYSLQFEVYIYTVKKSMYIYMIYRLNHVLGVFIILILFIHNRALATPNILYTIYTIYTISI